MSDVNVSTEFNIANYISPEKMREISERVFEERVEKFVDEIIRNRTYHVDNPNGFTDEQKKIGIVDQMLMMALNKYVDNTEDVEIINDFNKSIGYRLETIAAVYIKEHSDELSGIIESRLLEDIAKISDDKFAEILSKNIKFDDIIKSSILTFVKPKSE